MLSKKIHIAVGSILAASLLAFGVYKGYEHVKDNYLILSAEEVANIEQNIEVLRMQAYQMGQLSCKKESI